MPVYGPRWAAFDYDELHRIVRWRDTNDTHYSYTFDDEGRVVEVDGTGHALSGTLVYEPLPDGGMRTTVIDSLGATEVYVTNMRGRLVRYTDQLGHESVTEYDAGGDFVAATVDALGRRTEFTHDELGNVLSVTRADGGVERVDVGDGGRSVREFSADGALVSSAVFDAAGALVEQADATGVGTRYEYDERGGLRAVFSALGVATAVSCDAMGRPLTVKRSGVVAAVRRGFVPSG